jgi:membrane protease YdiL (CAAX protease family)
MTAMTAIPSPLLSARQVWGEFAAYLRRPSILQPSGLRAPGSAAVFFSMAALHLIVMVLLVPVLSFWQVKGGAGTPTAFSAVPQNYMVLLVVIAAPLIEEILFRGWLTGKPRALWLLLAGALCLLPLLLPTTHPLVSGGAILAGLVAMLTGWFVLRRHTAAPAWFARYFPVVFYSMVLMFGLTHVLNYSDPGLRTVPMVLPQLWCALTLGFVRMRIGLPAAILLHALSNALVLSFV